MTLKCLILETVEEERITLFHLSMQSFHRARIKRISTSYSGFLLFCTVHHARTLRLSWRELRNRLLESSPLCSHSVEHFLQIFSSTSPTRKATIKFKNCKDRNALAHSSSLTIR